VRSDDAAAVRLGLKIHVSIVGNVLVNPAVEK